MIKSTNDTVHSVDKALAILEALNRVGEIGISALDREFGFGKGTIYRLITTLRINGYVEQTETGKYKTTLKLFEMGNKDIKRLGIREVVHPYLEQMASDTKETINLAVLDDIYIIFIDRIESVEPLRMGLELGACFPAFCTALGRTMLAYRTTDEIQRILDETKNKGQMIHRTKNTIIDQETLKEHLQVIKEQGYCLDDENCITGIRAVAAPIFNYSGKVVAAVSIAGPALRLKEEVISNFITIVKTNAEKISIKLGYK